LLVPPFEPKMKNSMSMADEHPGALMEQLEQSKRTCCVKSSCPSRASRSAVLMYKGLATGAVYSTTDDVHVEHTTEDALRLIMTDWQQADCRADVYDLPERIVLAQSALFFGYPVERTDNLPAREYVQYILSWMEMKEQTGCVALISHTSSESLLVFMHAGKFAGAFLPDELQYFDDFLVVDVFTKNEVHSEVLALILPKELLSGAVLLGYSLSKIASESSL
jgi:hypothetical protein